jgi:hypothetical protein
MPSERVPLGLGVDAGGGGYGGAVVVAHEEILEVVMRRDGYGRQLVDQGRDDLGRRRGGAYVVRRALGWPRIRSLDARW